MCGWPTRAVCIGPPPARDSYLNIPAILVGRDHHRRRRHPSRLRLPVGECALRRDAAEAHGFTFIGPTPQHIRMMGDKIVAKQTAQELGLPLVPGSPRRQSTADEVAALGNEDRLPGADQGGARRRRRGMKVVENADDAAEAFALARAEARGRLRQRLGLPREVSWPAAPHRDPGAGRRPGRRRASRRARLLAAAPPPEGAGGGALARAERRAARRDRRARRRGDAQARAIAAPAPWSSCSRTASSTSSR